MFEKANLASKSSLATVMYFVSVWVKKQSRCSRCQDRSESELVFYLLHCVPSSLLCRMGVGGLCGPWQALPMGLQRCSKNFQNSVSL